MIECRQIAESAWDPNYWMPAASLIACVVIIVWFLVYITWLDKGGY